MALNLWKIISPPEPPLHYLLSINNNTSSQLSLLAPLFLSTNSSTTTSSSNGQTANRWLQRSGPPIHQFTDLVCQPLAHKPLKQFNQLINCQIAKLSQKPPGITPSPSSLSIFYLLSISIFHFILLSSIFYLIYLIYLLSSIVYLLTNQPNLSNLSSSIFYLLTST